MAKTAWVTGAGGFIGSAVCQALDRAGWAVVATGRRVRSFPKADRWVLADLASERPWARMSDIGPPDAVFYCAGPGTVAAAASDPRTSVSVTVDAVRDLCGWLGSAHPAVRLIGLSSAAVYGQAAPPWSEDIPLRPVSVYGAHKLHMETVLERARQDGLNTVAVRLFSTYGPGLRKQVLWESLSRVRSGESPLLLSGTGAETRDFIYIDDAVRFLLHIAAHPDPPPAINGGSGKAVRMDKLMAMWLAAVAPGVTALFTGAARSGDPSAMCADMRQAAAVGFVPRITLEDGLARTADSYRQQAYSDG